LAGFHDCSPISRKNLEIERNKASNFLAWGRVDITIWTHKIDGLTESDFILAAKIDQLYA
jgi:4a-hydroxytetrahydrobiopterin dehydratase